MTVEESQGDIKVSVSKAKLCKTCHGSKRQELQGGLVSKPCPDCYGLGNRVVVTMNGKRVVQDPDTRKLVKAVLKERIES